MPEEVAARAESYTGQFLRELLARRAEGARATTAKGARPGKRRQEAAE